MLEKFYFYFDKKIESTAARLKFLKSWIEIDSRKKLLYFNTYLIRFVEILLDYKRPNNHEPNNDLLFGEFELGSSENLKSEDEICNLVETLALFVVNVNVIYSSKLGEQLIINRKNDSSYEELDVTGTLFEFKLFFDENPHWNEWDNYSNELEDGKYFSEIIAILVLIWQLNILTSIQLIKVFEIFRAHYIQTKLTIPYNTVTANRFVNSFFRTFSIGEYLEFDSKQDEDQKNILYLTKNRNGRISGNKLVDKIVKSCFTNALAKDKRLLINDGKNEKAFSKAFNEFINKLKNRDFHTDGTKSLSTKLILLNDYRFGLFENEFHNEMFYEFTQFIGYRGKIRNGKVVTRGFNDFVKYNFEHLMPRNADKEIISDVEFYANERSNVMKNKFLVQKNSVYSSESEQKTLVGLHEKFRNMIGNLFLIDYDLNETLNNKPILEKIGIIHNLKNKSSLATMLSGELENIEKGGFEEIEMRTVNKLKIFLNNYVLMIWQIYNEI